MIKKLLLAVVVLSINTLHAQVLSFDHGEMEFCTATVLTDVEAVTEKMEVKLDIQTRNIEISVNINSFEFEYESKTQKLRIGRNKYTDIG